MKNQTSYGITHGIVCDLTQNIAAAAARFQFALETPAKIKETTVEYMNQTFQAINDFDMVRAQSNTKIMQSKEEKAVSYRKKKLIKRIHVFRNSQNQASNSREPGKNLSRKHASCLKSQDKGLIELAKQGDKDRELEETIQKLRNFKIKLSETYNEFSKPSCHHLSVLKPQDLQSKRPVITNYKGEVLNTEKVTNRKEGNWLDKNKIRPLFRLKEVSSLNSAETDPNRRLVNDCTENESIQFGGTRASLKLLTADPKKESKGFDMKSIMNFQKQLISKRRLR